MNAFYTVLALVTVPFWTRQGIQVSVWAYKICRNSCEF